MMIIMMPCKVVLINHQNSKYCCMFTFDSTHVILCYVYTIGYHSSSLGGHEGMFQAF